MVANPVDKDRSRSLVIHGTVVEPVRPEPALYLVSTPIGNLGDITLRALEILAACDLIACEDTRTTASLLSRYAITTPRISYNEHNAAERGEALLSEISSGKSVALVSDAGTPLVSDPGGRLVEDAIEAGISVVPVPGASAPLAALVASGFSTTSFVFSGFLAAKKQARRNAFEAMRDHSETGIFFESPKRLIACLEDMKDVLGPDRLVSVSREVTKLHETHYRGTIETVLSSIRALDRVRGEIVIVVDGAAKDGGAEIDLDGLLTDLLAHQSMRDAVAEAASLTGKPRKEVYARALELRDKASLAG
ncbi:MAG: 16S rRNA (cytidine(1402)-2'-O)-methyltransferase [Pseudomonadota bacterium]